MDEAPLIASRVELEKRMYSLELHRWLKSTGRKDVLNKYLNQEMGKKNYEQLINGLETEENSEEKLATIVRFAKPGVINRSLKSGEFMEDTLTETAGGAITKVLHGASNISRYEAGIHPVTLLTEQKRKVILHALMHKEHIRPKHRSGSDTLDKSGTQFTDSFTGSSYGADGGTELQNSKSTSHKSLTTKRLPQNSTTKMTDSLKYIPGSGRHQKMSSSALDDVNSVNSQETYTTIGTSRSNNLDRLVKLKGHIQSPSHPVTARSTKTHSAVKSNNAGFDYSNAQERKFQPKWEHYDTMRARWSYLHPQVRQLVPEDSHLAPDTNQRYLRVGDNVLNGKLKDIHYYETTNERQGEKSKRVMNHTGQLLADKIERENQYYKPNPCVYY